MKFLKWVFLMMVTAVSVAAIVYAVMSRDFCFSCLWEKIKNFFADICSQFLTEEDFCDLPVDDE